MRRRLGICGVLAVVLMVSSLSLSVGSSRADWTPYATLSSSPDTVYIGVSTTFEYELYNGKASSVDIYDITVQFDWQSTTYYDLVDTTVAVQPLSTYAFELTLTIPGVATGPHTAEVIIVGMAVGDWDDSTGTWTDTFEVQDIPELQVKISANPTSGDEPLTVSFTSYVNGGLSPYVYSWTFGDGTTDSVANPTHVYQEDGTYTVTLVVTDSMSSSESAQTTVTVSAKSGGLVMILVVVGAIVAVLLAVMYLIVRKKKMASPPAPPTNPPSQP